MEEGKQYFCECGKQFTNSQSFNAHKSNCKIHYEACGKDFDYVMQKRLASRKITTEKTKELTKQHKLQMWLEQNPVCERCGKAMTEKYGSGRFCSSTCAHARPQTAETRLKLHLSNASDVKLPLEAFLSRIQEQSKNSNNYQCSFCNRAFSQNKDLNSHITRTHINKKDQLYKIYSKNQGGYIELDVTNQFIQEYKSIQLTCEICGKTVVEATKNFKKGYVTQLCVDHDHITGKFRGLLCQQCNRQLGFFENYKDQILAYLNKNSNLESNENL